MRLDEAKRVILVPAQDADLTDFRRGLGRRSASLRIAFAVVSP